MPRQIPPLAWFRAFEAAARCQSFTLAAEELGLTQSAISQHVRSLEHRFGLTLFHRKARGIALTDGGRRLLPEVSRAISTLKNIAEIYDTRDDGDSLTIAASSSIIQWLLIPHLEGFKRRNPDLTLRFISTLWPDEFRMPVADIEIRFGAFSMVGHNANRLEPDDLIVVCAPNLSVTDNAMEKAPLIQAVGTTDDWGNWSRQTKITLNQEPALLVDSHGLAVDLARRGMGIALTSSLIAKPSLKDGSLVMLDQPSAKSHDGYYLALNEPEKPTVRDFHQWLQEIID